MENQLWTTFFKPINVENYSSNIKIVQSLQEWIKNPALYQFKPILIWGLPGIGKTTFSHLFLNSNGFETIEINASDTRSGKQVDEFLDKLFNISNVVFRKPALIMDECDGLSGGDKSGITSFINKYTKFKSILSKYPNKFIPIICICNEVSDKKMNDLMSICHIYHFSPPSNNEFLNIVQYIENHIKPFFFYKEFIPIIIQQSQNDFRRFIQILFEIYNGSIQLFLNNSKSFSLEDIHNLYTNPDYMKWMQTLIYTFEQRIIDLGLLINFKNLLNQYPQPLSKLLLQLETERTSYSSLFIDFSYYTLTPTKTSAILPYSNRTNIIRNIAHNYSSAEPLLHQIFYSQEWELFDIYQSIIAMKPLHSLLGNNSPIKKQISSTIQGYNANDVNHYIVAINQNTVFKKFITETFLPPQLNKPIYLHYFSTLLQHLVSIQSPMVSKILKSISSSIQYNNKEMATKSPNSPEFLDKVIKMNKISLDNFRNKTPFKPSNIKKFFSSK